MKKVKLGENYRDTIHGVVGIATCRSQYITGCERVCLEYVQDGDVKEYWVDEIRLEGITEEKAGGSHSIPPNRNPPKRR